MASPRFFDDRICWLTYTHSEYRDVFGLYNAQMSRYMPDIIPRFVTSDRLLPEYTTQSSFVQYNDSLPYSSRLLEALGKIPSYEFILFDHEDMFLYSEPDLETLCLHYRELASGAFDYIRLVKSTNCKYVPVVGCPYLYSLLPRSKWIFSIQPSFWRRRALMSVLEQGLNLGIWDLESKSQVVVRRAGIQSGFSHRAGQRRGMHHYDNDIYPYVATAIGKGRWNLAEYSEELLPLLSQHGINPEYRGWL